MPVGSSGSGLLWVYSNSFFFSQYGSCLLGVPHPGAINAQAFELAPYRKKERKKGRGDWFIEPCWFVLQEGSR